MSRASHRARLEAWSPDELKEHLSSVVDGIRHRDPEIRQVSPLDVALELLGGELEAFVLFARVGHLDPPREDGKVAIGILQRVSADPEVDLQIRTIVKKWAAEQERQS